MDTTDLEAALTAAATTVGTVAVGVLAVGAVIFAMRYVRRAIGG